MVYSISAKSGFKGGSITPPSSKSISNRVLIINALTKNPMPVYNLSDSDDTKAMITSLSSGGTLFDIGHAGTAMRFLTAYLAVIEGDWNLTGSERMKERPIGILVEALKELGADIRYAGKTGFPPLEIRGKKLSGKTIELDGSVSSQYISALLMIAPVISGGLTLKLKNEVASASYIELTLQLMRKFGIRYDRIPDEITVPEQSYLPLEFTVEADWSGASYWYETLALADSGEVFLKNLTLNSDQGDSCIARWFEWFGIASGQKETGVLLSKKAVIGPEKLELDFIENPDIAQTMACLCVARQIPFLFSGLKTLKIKETDRIAALQTELARFGAILTEPCPGTLSWDGKIERNRIENHPVIKTYNDHRMALSFAPMALTFGSLMIENPEVVTKSYPGFWDDLKRVGFLLNLS